MKRRWRPCALGVVSLCLAAGVAPPAVGLPVQDQNAGINFSCNGGESIRFESSGSFSTSGELVESTGSVSVGGTWSFLSEGSADDSTFSVTYSFLLPGDEPATVTLAAAYEAVGEPEVVESRFRDGNAWVGEDSVFQALAVTATVADASGSLAPLSGADLTCYGSEFDITLSGTDPATRIYRGSDRSAGCWLPDNGFLEVLGLGPRVFVWLALGRDFDEETVELEAQGQLRIRGDRIAGTLQVRQPETDPPQEVELNLTLGEVLDSGEGSSKTPREAHRFRYTTHALSGTAVLPDGTVISIGEDCALAESRFLDRYSSRAGNKKPPQNDHPENAISISAGETVTTSTSNAAEPPEAACDGVPLGRTVWYRIEGTGSDVTLSTTGSDFDTVLGVYDAASLTEIACVDDTFEGLQASVTFSTRPGTTYLVQVGGFAANWGSLVLSRS